MVNVLSFSVIVQGVVCYQYGLVSAVSICLCPLLARSCPVVGFGFSLCPFEMR